MKGIKRYSCYNILSFIFIIFLILFYSGDRQTNGNDPGLIRGILGSEARAKDNPPAAPAAAKDTEKYFTLNFKDADISEFLNVMGQLIGKNIIIDDKVQGKITISSVKKFPVSHAYQILLSILEVKGLAIVETPTLIKIIPVKEAIKKNAEIVVDGKTTSIRTVEEKTVTYLYSTKHADSNEIAATLRSLKPNDVDIVVYLPLNTIILSGVSSEIDGLIKIAQELDKDTKDKGEEEQVSSGNIHVVHLENADAEQLAGVLSRVPFSDQAKIAPSPAPAVSPATGTDESGAVRPSARTARTTQTQRTTTAAQRAATASSTSKLSIIANKETNSLIIYATPDEFKEIYRIIKELDMVRNQVLIEALIVEITADKSWNFGVDWMLGGKYSSDFYGGSSIMGSVPSWSDSSSLPSGKTASLPLSQGLQLGFLSSTTSLGFVLLSLSETDKNYNVLSTPQLLTIDNHEAELNIGEEIPVTSNTRVTDAGTQYSTYEYKSVGLKLKITPHITKNERITLDLYQEANDVLSTSSSTTLPTLTKRDIQTKVTVNDSQTIVIGGLIKNNKSVEETKVPFLGDIPLLGWFFKYKSVSYTKTNLLVFITPHIVTKEDKMNAITEQKQEEMNRIKVK